LKFAGDRDAQNKIKNQTIGSAGSKISSLSHKDNVVGNDKTSLPNSTLTQGFEAVGRHTQGEKVTKFFDNLMPEDSQKD